MGKHALCKYGVGGWGVVHNCPSTYILYEVKVSK